MLQIIRNNSPFTVLILFIFSLLIRLPALSHPVMPLPVEGLPVYNLLLYMTGFLVGGSAFGYTLLTALLLFLQALYLNTIVIRRRLVSRPTHIPVYGYLALTAIFPGFGHFSNLIFVNWCMLGALDMTLRFSQPANPRKHIYNAGFLVGMSTLFHFSSIGFIPVLLLGLLLLRSFNPREWFVVLLGICTPVYFLTGLLFLTDRLHELQHWPDPGRALSGRIDISVYAVGAVAGVIAMTTAGIYTLHQQTSRAAVFIRRGWSLVVCYGGIALPVAFFMNGAGGAAWLAVMPALSLIIVQPMYLEKNKRFSNIIFWFSLVFLVFCQLIYNG